MPQHQQKQTQKILKMTTKECCYCVPYYTPILPNAISKYINSVPRPCHQPIENAPPIWEYTDLNKKLPIFHGHTPVGPIIFHKGPLGNDPLDTEIPKIEFWLDNPNCHDVSYEYNPLHDPCLSNMMTTKDKCKFLYRQGLITNNLNVICTLTEYNQYRRFLWRNINKLIRYRMRKIEQQQLEQKKVFEAKMNHCKRMTRLQRILSENLNNKPKQEVPIKKKNTLKPKVETKEKLKTCSDEIDDIYPYTVYGLDKHGFKNQENYKGIFIKNLERNYHVIGDVERFVNFPAPFVKFESSQYDLDTNCNLKPLFIQH